ncbi:MAG: hypothetical protein H0W07_03115 [Chloroflexi bacterium]|nr:hypothetical protein [Chloroflexota bacterium]
MVADPGALTPSVVLRRGVFHVAYFHEQRSAGDEPSGVFYASNQGGTWHKERVSTGGDLYTRPSLVVDLDAVPHIAFTRTCFECTPFESNIWLASNATGTWDLDQLTDGKEDLAASLALGAYDLPTLGFPPPGSRQDLFVAWNRPGRGIFLGWRLAGGAWQVERAITTIGRCATLGTSPSIAMSGDGVPWLAYEQPRPNTTNCNPATRGIRVARPTEAGWQATTLTTNVDDSHPKLALGPSGRPHLIFHRSGVGIQYTRIRADDSWEPPTFAVDGNDATVTIDADRKAHVAYEGIGPGYATNRSGAWVATPLAGYDLDAGTDSPVSIVLTNTGKARVVFGRTQAATEDDLGLFVAREH